ncbi:hypothetical protein K437DRAFT_64804 [Tilletiaria anomala UBC 951]|uniref:Uncharacterized protein n=1 Tax=Tilletiaria anomala (strain ATCC 24038 / CBS 436.72 / UBC 951) TaxID=1037660 RepID=A0A066VBI1_TILAU|nr:uncharacterized protein K437DRAFT_64804 [Tilletiaria anomala UBC 951]KDN35920.1 hypothetical protein K437DRAFT_64804 [Tilletiaria anomala UBC 951]
MSVYPSASKVKSPWTRLLPFARCPLSLVLAGSSTRTSPMRSAERRAFTMRLTWTSFLVGAFCQYRCSTHPFVVKLQDSD